MSLPVLSGDPIERKATPIGSGVLDYFPDAIAEVARVSKIGNDQHNPGQPLHWAWGKSNDHWDCIARHGMERGTMDTDGARHSAKLAWRALALLQEELVAAGVAQIPRGARTEAVPKHTTSPTGWRCKCGETGFYSPARTEAKRREQYALGNAIYCSKPGCTKGMSPE